MSLTLPELLGRLTLVPVVAAALLGAARFRGLPRNLRWLVGLLAFAVPLNAAALVLMLRHRNNLFLMPVDAVGELGLLAWVYRHTLHWPRFTRWAPVLVGGFALYVLLDSFIAGDFLRFRPSQQVVQAVLLLALAGLYFRRLLHELRVRRLGQEPMFWVSAGLVLYNLGYLEIAWFSNYLLRYSDRLNMSVWAVHSLLFMALYGCYCRALWLSPPK